MSESIKKPLTYRDAGVDIQRGEELVARISGAAAATRRPGVMGGLGGFGGLFDLAQAGYQNPVLVSSTDGVGTKLLLAIELDRHDSIGLDLVAMCVNDIVVQGAEPLLFLDYFATGKLAVDTAETVIAGIASGCEEAGATLLGGETAEMPGMYPAGHYDLAGFCVGAVEKERLIDGSKVTAGDIVLGLASSGIHSNGYSLVRHILDTRQISLAEKHAHGTLGDILLTPTRIYVRPLLKTLKEHDLHALAHITGGGLTENIPRVIPSGLCAEIDLANWRLPEVFCWLRDQADLEQQELLRTFNCGIGMVVVAAAADAAAVTAALTAAGETVYEIGVIRHSDEAICFQGRLT